MASTSFTSTIVVDMTTNAINTAANPNTTGSRNSFRSYQPTITLPQQSNFNLVIQDVRYPTVDLTEEQSQIIYGVTFASLTDPQKVLVRRKCQSIVPLIIIDVVDSIRVNGRWGKLAYKCLFGSDDIESQQYHIDSMSDPSTFPLRVSGSVINGLQVDIVRSDNGQPYPFDETVGGCEIAILLTIAVADDGVDTNNPDIGKTSGNHVQRP